MRLPLLACFATLVALAAAQANPPNRGGAAVTTTPTPTSTEATSTVDPNLPPSPTESSGCYAHGDHWHCEGEASSESEEEYGETLSNGCVQHGTHYHCPAGVSPPCEAFLGDYDLGLHVVALFVLLVASGLGVFVPVIFGNKADKNKTFGNVFFILRHFGTGVILATAFIHLLMHAFVMFANECLGELEYEAVAPAIAMAALMVIFAIDYSAARWLARRSALHAHKEPASPLSSGDEKHGPFGGHDHDFSGVPDGVFAGSSSSRAKWDVKLLEAGICFHSIMIGVTLGSMTGSGFIPTFCAIIFHQLFEGLGLGARIGRLQYPNGGSWQKWLMCVVYTLITPLGIAIGIAVRTSFNLSGTSTILSIGILDSISAGILLYAGIAQLLVGDWLAGEMRTASAGRVAVGGVSLFLGLFAMSVIGKWA